MDEGYNRTVLSETLDFFLNNISELIRENAELMIDLHDIQCEMMNMQEELDKYKSLYMKKVREGGKR